MNERRLIIFTRLPVPGKSKTRLLPVLKPEEAADLHRIMTEKTIELVKRFCNEKCHPVIYFTGGSMKQAEKWLGSEIPIKKQPEGNLGERMSSAFRDAINEGAEKVALIGTDCPGLNETILDEAFKILEEKNVVMGPAMDGGYYLVGTRGYFPDIFRDIPWGTSDVFKMTLAKIRKAGLSHTALTPLRDIDRPEDLDLLSF